LTYCLYMSNRRNLRESVLKALYAHAQGGGDAAHVINMQIHPDIGKEKEEILFAEQLLLRTIKNSDEYDALISGKIKNWELGRIALVDKLILRMAICELLLFDDIPAKVTINEAIELAKEYSTANSGRFVNGVLDAIRDQLAVDSRIKKTGRGLVE
jgi:transcription antitermination protein NusB